MRTLLAVLLLAPIAALAGEDSSFDHSHAALDAFLGDAVRDSGVDYDDLATRRSVLDGYLSELETTDISEFGPKARLAFWINAYNGLTLRLILDEKPAKSIMDIDGGQVWKTRKYAVAGEQISLDDIEHKRIRPIGDGRIHSAVNCASKGCPPLAPDPFTPSGLEAQLDAGAKRWAATNAYVLTDDELKLSSLFDWFAEDFTSADKAAVTGANDKQAAAIQWLSTYAPDDAARMSSGELSVSWNAYDWSLNNR